MGEGVGSKTSSREDAGGLERSQINNKGADGRRGSRLAWRLSSLVEDSIGQVLNRELAVLGVGNPALGSHVGDAQTGQKTR